MTSDVVKDPYGTLTRPAILDDVYPRVAPWRVWIRCCCFYSQLGDALV